MSEKEDVMKDVKAVADYAPLFVEEIIKVLQARESEVHLKFDDLKLSGEATLKVSLLRKENKKQ